MKKELCTRWGKCRIEELCDGFGILTAGDFDTVCLDYETPTRKSYNKKFREYIHDGTRKQRTR